MVLFRSRLLEDKTKEFELADDDQDEDSEDSEERSENLVAEYKHTLDILKEDLTQLKTLLKRKRENTVEILGTNTKDGDTTTSDSLFLNEYDQFLIRFYANNIKDSGDNKPADVKKYIYLYSKLKQEALGKDEQSSLAHRFYKGKKLIGITPEAIFELPKYQVNPQNMPKFSKMFERIATSNEEYNNNRIYLNIDPNDIKIKKKQTLSFIERHNSEALKSIEEKRQKFKHLSKTNKEKMDNNNLHKHWNWMVKREIPKMYKIYQKYKADVEFNCKKFATMVQKEVKKKAAKVQRMQKEVNMRARKLQREMVVFWRKRDKEMQEMKKKKDKIEIEKKKKEDELQEAVIQKKRLEYIMKQSDIYSFFMIKNMGMAIKTDEDEKKDVEMVESGEEATNNNQENVNEEANENNNETNANNTHQPKTEIIGNTEVQINPKTNKIIFQSIKVDVDEKAAKEGVKQMINRTREKALRFDQQMNRIRTTLGGDEAKLSSVQECKDEDLALEGLDNPHLQNQSSELIEAPKSFLGELKEYQLKGLRWLDNLYEQGINGILADEMGLGKTIQAISLLAHLSEEKNNWGPFLVVAPNATLYNWQQEVNRFCPNLKVLPYWGGLKERKTLRKFFGPTNLYTRNASFHVCITSYQLVVSDAKVFNRVNWQHMILDEAQAIKNINSQRWNILLDFNCRNRLLLSGTPIQNSMSELWALLHFIMPNLFDSHEQFQEWFSKDIEAHSQEKGELNQEQLKRLHKILKPFMLRRVKKDVENEIGPKVEVEILCEMTERQKVLYNSIKEKLSNISDLFSSVDSKVKVENLMNLVMQFRKVCNHPELFERHIGKVPFIFRDLVFSRTATFLNATNIADLRIEKFSGVNLVLPKLIFDECFDVSNNLIKKFNVLNTKEDLNENSVLGFMKLLNISNSDFFSLIKSDSLVAQICLLHYLNELGSQNNYFTNQELFENKDFDSIEPFGPLNKFTKSNKIARNKKLSLFINSRLYPLNEQINILYKSRDGILNPLINESIIELKKNYLYKDFKVNLS
jgi:SNF2 family DNA or RNA helicase